MSFIVTIVGHPNVGKSTLFNRLVGRHIALVHQQPGVTRDRREGQAAIGDLVFTVIDTAGLEESTHDTIERRLYTQTWKAVEDADVVLLLIDARIGVMPIDLYFADILRRCATPVVLVANKCEGIARHISLEEAHILGLGEPVLLSAEHGEGFINLAEALLPFRGRDFDSERAVSSQRTKCAAESSITLAIIGRPNVGKSTLVNLLVGEERMVTGPEACITRDAISINWAWHGHSFRLIDTAGIRRRARVTDTIEKMAVIDALGAIGRAQVVVLLLDVNAMLEHQDLALARIVIGEGRALIVAVNKCDMTLDYAIALKWLQVRLVNALPQVRGLPIVAISAITGMGTEVLIRAVFDIYSLWNQRVPTATLNRWLARAVENHPPPLSRHNRHLRLRYLTQTSTRPPTFVLFTNRPDDLPGFYLRYLVNDLRQTFCLPGVPVRLYPRRRENPYA